MKNNWFKIILLVQDVRCSSFINVSRNESHAPLPIFHVPGIWWGSFSGDGISEQNLESPLLLLFVLSQFFFSHNQNWFSLLNTMLRRLAKVVYILICLKLKAFSHFYKPNQKNSLYLCRTHPSKHPWYPQKQPIKNQRVLVSAKMFSLN